MGSDSSAENTANAPEFMPELSAQKFWISMKKGFKLIVDFIYVTPTYLIRT
jgi:hypothetical protein